MESPSASKDLDALSELQRKLDDLGVMFYTYLGIIQRDAPPIARAPDEADEAQNDDTTRKELMDKAPEYAKDIVRANREIEGIINRLEKDLEEYDDDDRSLFVEADKQSSEAGTDLNNAADDAMKLLTNIRKVASIRDKDDSSTKCVT